MKTNKKGLIKLNNEGVTLVEIIVAMLILAIVVVPFVHSFVTSASTNKKSRETLYGTTIAEDIMELFEDADVKQESVDIQALISAESALGVTDPGSVSVDTDGVYEIKMGSSTLSKYVSEAFAGDGYSAEIVLNPCNDVTKGDGTVEPGKYNKVNVESGNLASIANINGKTCGIYKMETNTDKDAIGMLQTEAGGGKSFDEIKNATNRLLKIDIIYNDVHVPTGIQFVKVRVTLNYTYNGHTITYSQNTVYDNTVELSQQAYPLENIFIIFSPLYSNVAPNKTYDSIEITNEHNIPVSLYLIHETSDLGGEENYPGYKVPIRIIENQSNTKFDEPGYSAATKLFTNLYKEEVSTSIDSYFAYSIDSSKVNYQMTYYPNASSPSCADFALCNSILNVRSADGRYLFGETVTRNRIYDMTVKVFKDGKKLVELTGTKTN